MTVVGTPSPFGSRARTQALLAIQLLTESYPRELARLLRISLSSVQKGLQSLEEDGLVVARSVGRTRVFRLNPRAFGLVELTRYLDRLLERENGLRSRAENLRRRPRRTGKPL